MKAAQYKGWRLFRENLDAGKTANLTTKNTKKHEENILWSTRSKRTLSQLQIIEMPRIFALVVVTPKNTNMSTMVNLTSHSHLALLRILRVFVVSLV
ncbi:MAG: hypothetical protein AABM64_08740 [Pseudomonadota bacterium]